MIVTPHAHHRRCRPRRRTTRAPFRFQQAPSAKRRPLGHRVIRSATSSRAALPTLDAVGLFEFAPALFGCTWSFPFNVAQGDRVRKPGRASGERLPTFGGCQTLLLGGFDIRRGFKAIGGLAHKARIAHFVPVSRAVLRVDGKALGQIGALTKVPDDIGGGSSVHGSLPFFDVARGDRGGNRTRNITNFVNALPVKAAANSEPVTKFTHNGCVRRGLKSIGGLTYCCALCVLQIYIIVVRNGSKVPDNVGGGSFVHVPTTLHRTPNAVKLNSTVRGLA